MKNNFRVCRKEPLLKNERKVPALFLGGLENSTLEYTIEIHYKLFDKIFTQIKCASNTLTNVCKCHKEAKERRNTEGIYLEDNIRPLEIG